MAIPAFSMLSVHVRVCMNKGWECLDMYTRLQTLIKVQTQVQIQASFVATPVVKGFQESLHGVTTRSPLEVKQWKFAEASKHSQNDSCT